MNTSYQKAVDLSTRGIVLCNNIERIDGEVKYYFDENRLVDVFQTYICDLSADVATILNWFPDLLIGYSPKLDCHLLFVDHWGTSWKIEETRTTIERIAIA